MLGSSRASVVRCPKYSAKRGKTPVLSSDEARELLASIESGSYIELRDRGLTGTMAYTFARVAGSGLMVQTRAVFSSMTPSRMTITPSRFKSQDYEERWSHARRRMHASDLAALLIGTGPNLRYLSGYPSPDRSVVRPFFFFLPLEGDPVLLTHQAYFAETKRFGMVADVRDYAALAHPPIALLDELIKEFRIGDKAIGMEFGREQTLDLCVNDLEKLRVALSPAVLTDCSELLWSLRAIKSPGELACIREACDITSLAYNRAFSALDEGVTEREIHRVMKSCLRDGTGDSVFLVITSGEGNYDLVTKPPEGRVLRTGDMVWMDAGCAVEGYWSDFSRGAVVGQPSDKQQAAHNAVRDITCDALTMVKPGVRVCDIARRCLRSIEKLPFPITSSIAARAGRVGHGLGLNLTEPPHLGLHDETELQPDMVITLEPGFATDYGTFHVEENVWVTNDGGVLLSNCSRDLNAGSGR